jgi:F-type H+-transporting ATPase subunit b
MEQTVQALGGILVKAIPTVILLIFLHFYFKIMLFGPLQKVLKQRDELTEGARKAAQNSLAAAERKAAEYEAKLRDARAEVYKEQEEIRKRWLEDQAAQLAQARQRSEESVKKARLEINAEATAARQNLLETSAALGESIANTILAKKAAR